MIVAEKPLNVKISKDIAPSQFRIKASAKAFSILSSKLYTNAFTAITRELSTNAADSHVAAGKANVPFTVHLPNNFEPWFSVSDQGTGMTEDHVKLLYTTYFESDKVESNDYAGCLGLGSKSPFSYTDQFTVESIYNGVKRTYNCFVNADGYPNIALLGEEETKEVNGVTVKFPVKRENFNDFYYAAKEVLSWFNPLPNVTGWSDFEFEKREYLCENKEYALRKRNSYNASHVVMGNVAYQVDPNKASFGGLERKILEWGVDLFVPIGSIDFAASREEISYDKTTLAVVKAGLAKAITHIQNELENAIGKAATLWDARCGLHEAKHSVMGQIKDLVSIKWNGKTVKEFVSINDVLEEAATNAAYNCANTIGLQTVKENYKGKLKKQNATHIYADKLPIYVNDLERGGYVRIMIEVQKLKKEHERMAYILSGVTKEWLEATGINTVAVYASKLPKPPRTPQSSVPRGERKTRARLNVFKDGGYSSDSPANFWNAADVDVREGGIYVEILYYKYKKPTTSEMHHPSELGTIQGLLRQMGYNKPIYGIRPVDVPFLEKHSGWLSLDEYVECILAENKSLLEKAEKAAQWNELDDSRVAKWSDKSLDEDSPFRKFAEECEEAKKCQNENRVTAYVSLANRYNVKIGEFKDRHALDNKWKEILARYPMLKHVSSYDSSHGLRGEVVSYIKMVDNCTKE
jgi:hypothetical protein